MSDRLVLNDFFCMGLKYLNQCFPNFFGLAPPWLPDKFPAPP